MRVGRVLAIAVMGICPACAADDSGARSEFGNCSSHYSPVATASTWHDLRDGVLAYAERGPVTALRVQGARHGIGPSGTNVVRVVDLLDHKGRTIAQADVWRTDVGEWRAAIWNQCID